MYQRVVSRNRRPISSVGLIGRAVPTTPWRRAPGPRYKMIASPAVTSFQYDQGLGFSLNPLKLVKRAAGAVVGAVKSVFRDSSVTLPDGRTVPTRDLPAVVRGTSITFGAPAPSPIEQAVGAVPGGMGTIAAVGIGAVVLAMAMSRRRG